MSYFVTNKNTKGFSIRLNKEVEKDIKFSWIALAVDNANTFESILPGLIINDNSNITPNNSQQQNNTEENLITEIVDSSIDTTIENTNTELENISDENQEIEQAQVSENTEEVIVNNEPVQEI